MIYRFSQPVCIVTSVSIKFFRGHYLTDRPLLIPLRVKVSVGFSTSHMHFVSEEVDVKPRVGKNFVVGLPDVVVGSFIRIDMLGKARSIYENNLYYTLR